MTRADAVRLTRSMRFRLLVPVTVVCAVTVLFSALAPNWVATRLIGQGLRDRAQSVALTVGYAAESSMKPEGLRRLVNAMGADGDVAHIVAVAGDPSRVVASTSNAWIGAAADELPTAIIDRHAAHALATGIDGSGSLDECCGFYSVVPIDTEAELSLLSGGAVLVVMDSARAEAEIAVWSRRIAGVLIAGALLVVSLGLHLLHGVVLRPLDRIVAAMEGNDEAPMPETQELAMVAETYNANRASAIASNAALERALRQIEQASHAKSAFLANMSHEIRTPMTAILGYVDLLGDRVVTDPDEAGDMMRAVRSNGDLLLTIINDILDVSKIEAGRLAIERIETDPAAVVGDTVDLLRPGAAERGLGIEITYGTPVPERITSDPTRLRQIVHNLVGNAIKFTEHGSVTVTLACEPGRRVLTIAVADTGCGMTDLEREVVARFRPFTQADAGVTRRFGGSGLGLCIANGLAERLGGGIRIESEPGVGSTFTATVGTGNLSGVPMHEGEAMRPAVTAPGPRATGGERLAGLRIAVAEDGPDNQRLIRILLEKAGAAVEVHENGRVLLDALEGAPDPDLVLMDMQMPEMDGYTAARRLRGRGFGRPIVALTAHAMAGDRDKCLGAGCDDYLSKPIDRAALYDACERWAREGRSGRSAA